MVTHLPPVRSRKSIRCPLPLNRSSIPPCCRPCCFSRWPTPSSCIKSTVPCSSTPARILSSTYLRVCSSRTTDSIPRRCSNSDKKSPAGPAPTIPICVRMFLKTIPHRRHRYHRSRGFDQGCLQNNFHDTAINPIQCRASKLQPYAHFVGGCSHRATPRMRPLY